MCLAQRFTGFLNFRIAGRNQSNLDTEQTRFIRIPIQFNRPGKQVQPVKIDLAFGHKDELAHDTGSSVDPVDLIESADRIASVLSEWMRKQRFGGQCTARTPPDNEQGRR